jgi:organic radical activating enzyme
MGRASKVVKVFPIEIVNNDYTEYLDVAYNISNVCNYRCWYCGPESNSGVDKFPSDIDLLTKNLDHFFNIYRTKFNKKDIRINLMGGEPTLWKNIEQFVKHYHSQNCRINMATNASRKMRWFNENARFFDDIHVSVHFQYCDPAHLIEVLDFLYYETDVLGNASILMDIENWNRCKDIADQMIEHPTPWVFKVKPIIANGTLLPYNEEQLEYLKEKVKKKPPQEYIDKQIRLGRIPNK